MMGNKATAVLNKPMEATIRDENNESSQIQKEQALFTARKKSEYEKESNTNQLNVMQLQLTKIHKEFSNLQKNEMEKSVTQGS